jgi:hypothetical protein
VPIPPAAHLIAHAATLVAGLVVVLATWQSIIFTIILPRKTRNWIAGITWEATYRIGNALASFAPNDARRDGVLALLGPLNIVVLLFTWMALFVVGFAALFWALGGVGPDGAFDLAGSSFFTLGFATRNGGPDHALMYAAAASGMIVIALQIGYLPTIYGAYSQREALVTLLNMRCQEYGVIAGPMVLTNHPLPECAHMLRDLFTSWEACAAAIIESHTNYPWLIVFRSPRPSESWVTSMLAILDAIALLAAVEPEALTAEAQHCRFACTAALRELATMLRPRPRRPARTPRITRDDFALALRQIGGVAAEVDVDRAWVVFRQERAAYEAAVIDLAVFMRRPLTGWLRLTAP